MIGLKTHEEARKALQEGAVVLTNQDFLKLTGIKEDMPKAYSWLYKTNGQHSKGPTLCSSRDYVYFLVGDKRPTHRVMFDETDQPILHNEKCPGCKFCSPSAEKSV